MWIHALALVSFAFPPSAEAHPLLGSLLRQDDTQEPEREAKEKAVKDKEARAREAGRRDEGAKALAEEAHRRAAAVAAAGPGVPSLALAPRMALPGGSVLLTLSRTESAPAPGAPPSPATARPILPQNVILRFPDGSEKRLEPSTLARPPEAPPPAGPAGVSLVKRTFDLAKPLEGASPGTVLVSYDNQGTQIGPVPVAVLKELKGVDVEKIDPKTVLVVIETDAGAMFAELLPDKAPNTVRHFLRLASQGFYDGLTFNRIVKDLLVQGGDPATGGRTYSGEPLKAEFNDRPHRKGTLAMARGLADPDSATCQFFIVHKSHARYLDRDYSGQGGFPTTAFAALVEGSETLDRLAALPVQPNSRGEVSQPMRPPVIKRMVLAEKPGAGRGVAPAPVKPVLPPPAPPQPAPGAAKDQ